MFFFFFSFTFASFAGDDEAFNFETTFAAADDDDDEGEVPSTFEDAHPIDRKRRVKESTTFVRAAMCCARRISNRVVLASRNK